MPTVKYSLPSYPASDDVWQLLKREVRPIMVYGMGNGADKLFARFEALGIGVREVFASDGFVRGHSYRGFKVKSFSEIKAEYPDFVIVLSFASNRPEVIEMLSQIDMDYDMYVPDMPIAGEEYFDSAFYNANYSRIKRVYDSLSDEESQSIYASVIRYRLEGKIKYLLDCYTERADMYSLISSVGVRRMIDAGAYNGDTAREAVEFLGDLEHIYAVEPDPKTFKRLERYAASAEIPVTAVNAAVYNECTRGSFASSANRNSTISATPSYKHGESEINLITIDSLGVSDADYIKYDVEGAEYEALQGSVETVKSLPALLISLYHRSKDIFFLPEYVLDNHPEYDLFLRRLLAIPAWELNLIALPKKRKG